MKKINFNMDINNKKNKLHLNKRIKSNNISIDNNKK
jgi:hypothetical protein